MSAPRLNFPYGSGGGGGGGSVSGTGTPNRIPIWNGATSLSDSPLTVSGNNVIGAGAIRATGTTQTTPAFSRHDSTTSGIYFPGVNEIGFTINNQHAMYISTGRNVGIGTASPSYPLHVGAGNNTGIVTTGPTAYVATNGATSLVVRDATNGIESFIYAGSSVVLAGSASAHAYQIRTSNNTRITVSATGDTSIANTLSFNSGFGSAAVAYGTRVWVNFNGTGIISIRGSGNVSSVADGGTGVYTVNFTSAMPDSNYAVTASAWYDGVAAGAGGVTSRSTTSVTVKTVATQTAALVDMLECHFSIFR